MTGTTARSVTHASFTVERTYDASPARVFHAWSDLDAKRQWFSDPNDHGGEHSLDFRVGGREHHLGSAPNGSTYAYDAVYQDIVENERIVYTYDMHLGDERISVSLGVVELSATGDRTTLVYTEHGAFLDGLDKPSDREHGTNVLLDALGTALAATNDVTRAQDALMAIRTKPWPVGVPCWADLSVPDVDAAQEFYGAVLGWEFAPPNPEFGGYVIGERRGGSAAGIGPVMAADQGSSWTLYFASEDADATAAAVSEHGGTIVVPAGDVGPLGRMFLATDPGGATFGVWQAGTHIGAGVANEPGGITWEDLRSNDPGASRAFFESVFGFVYDAMPMAPGDYRTFRHADSDAPLGGMGGMFGADGPSHWLVYFGVSDTRAAVAAAESNGGTIAMRETETPFGLMAAIVDPWGAVFQVVETDGTNQPER